MKQIEAVIFDWAGTTVDYGCMAPMQAMQEAFAQQQLNVTLDEIRKPMGMLKIDHIKTILEMDRVRLNFKNMHGKSHDAADIQKIYQCFEKNIFSVLNTHSKVIEGTLVVQDYLRGRNIKIGSTTGYTQQMINIVAQGAKQQGYHPDHIVSADQVARGRPYPYMLQQNLVALDIQDVRRVIKVGDTIVDVLEGLNAGCWSIGVIKGSSTLGLNEEEVSRMPSHELRQKISKVRHEMFLAGAHYVIDTLDELPWVIDVIQQKNTTSLSA